MCQALLEAGDTTDFSGRGEKEISEFQGAGRVSNGRQSHRRSVGALSDHCICCCLWFLWVRTQKAQPRGSILVL